MIFSEYIIFFITGETNIRIHPSSERHFNMSSMYHCRLLAADHHRLSEFLATALSMQASYVSMIFMKQFTVFYMRSFRHCRREVILIEKIIHNRSVTISAA
jgi:hypothetical protein